MTGPR